MLISGNTATFGWSGIHMASIVIKERDATNWKEIESEALHSLLTVALKYIYKQ